MNKKKLLMLDPWFYSKTFSAQTFNEGIVGQTAGLIKPSKFYLCSETVKVALFLLLSASLLEYIHCVMHQALFNFPVPSFERKGAEDLDLEMGSAPSWPCTTTST